MDEFERGVITGWASAVFGALLASGEIAAGIALAFIFFAGSYLAGRNSEL